MTPYSFLPSFRRISSPGSEEPATQRADSSSTGFTKQRMNRVSSPGGSEASRALPGVPGALTDVSAAWRPEIAPGPPNGHGGVARMGGRPFQSPIEPHSSPAESCKEKLKVHAGSVPRGPPRVQNSGNRGAAHYGKVCRRHGMLSTTSVNSDTRSELPSSLWLNSGGRSLPGGNANVNLSYFTVRLSELGSVLSLTGLPHAAISV